MANAVILNKLISELGISMNAFEKNIGVANGRIRKAVERESDITTDTIEKIVSTYPEVSRNWLLTGEDPMFSKELSIKSGKKREVIPLGKHAPLRITADQYAEAFGDWPGLPMYNVPITASFIATYREDTSYEPFYYLHDPRFRDCDFGAVITGDSMHSEIRHGDFVACKEIEDTRFIVYGDIYYIVATNGLETCKYVNKDPDNPDNLLLVAKNEKISSSPLPKDMLHKLYKVRGIVRQY